eukprot:1354182-Amorphochlora_amoeboformis.AAC.1
MNAKDVHHRQGISGIFDLRGAGPPGGLEELPEPRAGVVDCLLGDARGYDGIFNRHPPDSPKTGR